MMQLEARVARLEEENKILYNIKDELSEANSELERNKTLLMNTCSDLAQQVERLEKSSKGNLGVLEKLRNTVEKDIQAIAERDKVIHTLGQKFQEQKTFVEEAEQALKRRFAEIYEGYKAALMKFGAEPLPFPSDEGEKEMFD